MHCPLEATVSTLVVSIFPTPQEVTCRHAHKLLPEPWTTLLQGQGQQPGNGSPPTPQNLCHKKGLPYVINTFIQEMNVYSGAGPLAQW